MSDLDRAEQLIVDRLKRYAANTRRQGVPGTLDAGKVIAIIRERFRFVRTGEMPMHDAGRGERARLHSNGAPFDIKPGESYTDATGNEWELTDHGQWKAAGVQMCEDCGKLPADPPSRLCPGCEAYREHTGQI